MLVCASCNGQPNECWCQWTILTREAEKHTVKLPEKQSPFDNDGNYELSNCRWATASQQNKNRSPFRARG